MGLKSNYQYLKEWGINNRQNLTTGAFLALGFLIGLGIGLLVGTQKPSPIIIDKNVKVSLPGRQMEFSKNPEKTFNWIIERLYLCNAFCVLFISLILANK